MLHISDWFTSNQAGVFCKRLFSTLEGSLKQTRGMKHLLKSPEADYFNERGQTQSGFPEPHEMSDLAWNLKPGPPSCRQACRKSCRWDLRALHETMHLSLLAVFYWGICVWLCWHTIWVATWDERSNPWVWNDPELLGNKVEQVGEWPWPYDFTMGSSTLSFRKKPKKCQRGASTKPPRSLLPLAISFFKRITATHLRTLCFRVEWSAFRVFLCTSVGKYPWLQSFICSQRWRR